MVLNETGITYTSEPHAAATYVLDKERERRLKRRGMGPQPLHASTSPVDESVDGRPTKVALFFYRFYYIIYAYMSEIYPVTSCDVSLANVVNKIEIDAEKTAAYMRSIGYTDEQIAATTISAEDYDRHRGEWGLPKNHAYRALGLALLNTMHVVILPGAMSSAANLCREKNIHGPVDGVMTPKQFDEAASRKSSRVVAHELLHLIKDINDGTRSSVETIRSLGELGPEADAIYQDYENDPHEAHCREAEENAPEDLVRISYKAQPFIRRKIKRLRNQNRRVISRVQ